jgi:peroxiredoxin Q/BCP
MAAKKAQRSLEQHVAGVGASHTKRAHKKKKKKVGHPAVSKRASKKESSKSRAAKRSAPKKTTRKSAPKKKAPGKATRKRGASQSSMAQEAWVKAVKPPATKQESAQAGQKRTPKTKASVKAAPKQVAGPRRPAGKRSASEVEVAPKGALKAEVAPKPARKASKPRLPKPRTPAQAIQRGAVTYPGATGETPKPTDRDLTLPEPSEGELDEEDEPAPAFALPDQDGRVLSTSELLGRPYVLYFYPRDDTAGCTVEACDFRDESPAFERAGVRVVGVSPDSVESHSRFRDKHQLPFTLLSDARHEVAKAFRVSAEKAARGKQRLGVNRSTFLVSSDGRIVKSWRGVKVAGHVAEVLRAARTIA